MDEDDVAIVPVEDVIVRPSVLKEKIKRPISDKQRENVAKLVEANKARWAKMKEEKEKAKEAEKERIREELRAEVEAKLKAGTHVRAKVVKSGQGPKPKPKVNMVEPPTETPTETEPDTTEVEDSDDEPLPPRRAVRQARRQIRALQKIDEVLESASNPYLSKLMGRWK